MATRGIWTFVDRDTVPETEYHVYKHWDNYPSGASACIIKVLLSKLCWEWPRWEADEFAAAFIAANKSGPGDIRLAASRHAAQDVAYGYSLWASPDGTNLRIRVVETDYWGKTSETLVFEGTVMGFLEEFPPFYAVTFDSAGETCLRSDDYEGVIRYREEMAQLKRLGYR
jgi:hypothetical protein